MHGTEKEQSTSTPFLKSLKRTEKPFVLMFFSIAVMINWSYISIFKFLYMLCTNIATAGTENIVFPVIFPWNIEILYQWCCYHLLILILVFKLLCKWYILGCGVFKEPPRWCAARCKIPFPLKLKARSIPVGQSWPLILLLAWPVYITNVLPSRSVDSTVGLLGLLRSLTSFH